MSEGTPENNGLNDPMNTRNTDTGTLQRISSVTQPSAQGRKTLKLRPMPKPGAPKPVEPPPSTPIPPPVMSTSETEKTGETPTVSVNRVKKPLPVADQPTANIPMESAIPAPPPSSSAVPGAKQTIKLRPSTVPSAPPPVSMPGVSEAPPPPMPQPSPVSAQTIRLTQQPANEPETGTSHIARQTIKLVPPSQQGAQPSAAAPSAPTIKLGGAPTPSSPSAQTIKLTPESNSAQVAASSPTINLAGGSPAMDSKPKLSLKKNTEPVAPPPPSVANPPPGAMSKDMESEKSEPSLAFTITAAVALVVILFGAFAMFAQYSNLWKNGDINVPGFERLAK